MILPALVLLSVCCQLSISEATEPEIICSSEPVEAVYNESAILQCHLKPPKDVTDKTVKWTLGNDVVLLHQDGKDHPEAQRERFEGRAVLSQERLTKGNLSLELSSLKLSDSGRYKCAFITENMEKSCYVNFTVGESDVIGSDEPVKANVGQDVILPCHLEPPFNVLNLTVEWKFNNTFVHVYRSKGDYLRNQNNQFKNRTRLFYKEMHEGNISLQLRNVSRGDEGLYICHVPKLHSQVKRGTITLKVVAAGNHTKQQTDGSKHNVIIVVGVVGVVVSVLVGVAVYICKRRRLHGGQNNQQNNSQEGEQQEDMNLVQRNNSQEGEQQEDLNHDSAL